MTTIPTTLTSHEVFKLLGHEEVNRIAEFSSEKRFDTGEIIYRKDTPASHFFIILEGTVLLQLPGSPRSDSLGITRLGKGEMIGVSPVLGFDRYTVRAVAETKATLLAVEVKPFLAVLEKNPTAKMAVVSAVARAFYARYLGLVATLQGIVGQLTLK
jgi:CRP-like cAMP-binding protein